MPPGKLWRGRTGARHIGVVSGVHELPFDQVMVSLPNIVPNSVRSPSVKFNTGPLRPQCAGNAPLAGYRLATTCQAQNDCRDTNAYATTVCTLTGAAGYSTNTATKQCGVGIPTTQNFAVSAVSFCPIGFSHLFQVSGGTRGSVAGDSGGSCTPTSDTNVSMSCGSLVFGSFQCLILGDCVAN